MNRVFTLKMVVQIAGANIHGKGNVTGCNIVFALFIEQLSSY
jgi:hypothetical protein